MAKSTKIKFSLNKKQRKQLNKWVKQQPRSNLDLVYCFSNSSGIGVEINVVNRTTDDVIILTDYSTW